MDHLAPFPALVPNGEGLNRRPERPEALRRRMAEVFGAPADCVLPVAGAAHGLDLLSRLAPIETVGPGFGLEAARTRAAEVEPALLVADESLLLDERLSLAALAIEARNVAVLRDLGFPYGLAGACVGAVIGRASLITRLEPLVEPWALPVPSVLAAHAALSPSRAAAAAERLALVVAEKARAADALRAAGYAVDEALGPSVTLRPKDVARAERLLRRFGAAFSVEGGAFRLDIGPPEMNDRALAALGAVAGKPRRRAEVVRDTKETRIAVAVDLDAPAPIKVCTGVGFFDHMLEQIAAHGGFSLVVGCDGDLHVEAHHTVEDVMLAFGQALRQALGDRRGIARFGFVLPMDEAEAKVSLDLGGRPYAVFEGDFRVAALGDYPTEMTGHCFRSLAETLGAAVHVSVTGENDHHKTEACFKALGRALRQAIRIEGDTVPSTKGVVA